MSIYSFFNKRKEVGGTEAHFRFITQTDIKTDRQKHRGRQTVRRAREENCRETDIETKTNRVKNKIK